jgi:Na+-translocating ferredoxin:NAD+ oxidoreductase RnfG subunit
MTTPGKILWLSSAALAGSLATGHAVTYLNVEQAQQAIFPGARLTAVPLKLSDAQRKAIEKASDQRVRQTELKVWQVEGGGWFIVDEVIGKHEFITYATAISPAGKVLGVEILSYRETHGGQVREPSWRKTLVGKTLADHFKLDDDVPNITGATLSCRNVMDGVKRMLVIHKLYLASHA